MRPSLTATALVLAGSTAAAFAADTDIKAAIDQQNTKFEQAYNAGDLDTIAALYAEDGAVLPPDAARQDGHDAIRAFWSGAMEQGLKDLDLTAVEVYPAGDMATEIGTFTATAPAAEGSAPTALTGKYIVLWKRGDDGAWLLHRDIWNMGQ